MIENYKSKKIFIAGHCGMVGTALLNEFNAQGYDNLLLIPKSELDLRNQAKVNTFFQQEKPAVVVLAAAKVGGINANMNNSATFILDNLLIQTNVIDSAFKNKTEKLIFLGSSCIYPRECPQPMKEEYLLTGKLEPTNEAYAIAKITGIKMLEAYYKQYGFKSISLMPCNLYGPHDSFDLNNSHVLSALVKRIVDAKEKNLNEIVFWGTGIAKREFMHEKDIAKAIIFMMNNYNLNEIINIGWGEDISIKELADLIKQKVNYQGNFIWDNSKPDGMLRKCLDVSKMKTFGFSPKITLANGIEEMIDVYINLKNRNI